MMQKVAPSFQSPWSNTDAGKTNPGEFSGENVKNHAGKAPVENVPSDHQAPALGANRGVS